MASTRDHRHHCGHRVRAAAAVTLAALALVLALPAARADVTRSGDEPWYGRATAEARQRAAALFAQAVEQNQQLLRGEAKVLYEQALAVWDNPDIRWNLALVLDDLGQYLQAYAHLASALAWGAGARWCCRASTTSPVLDWRRWFDSERLAPLPIAISSVADSRRDE